MPRSHTHRMALELDPGDPLRARMIEVVADRQAVDLVDTRARVQYLEAQLKLIQEDEAPRVSLMYQVEPRVPLELRREGDGPAVVLIGGGGGGGLCGPKDYDL